MNMQLTSNSKHVFSLSTLLLLVCSLVVLGLTQKALGATIDEFTAIDFANDVVDGGPGESSSTGPVISGILGGSRDINANAMSGAVDNNLNDICDVGDGDQCSRLTVGGGNLVFSNDGVVVGVATLQWDGDPTFTSPPNTSILAVDLTDGGVLDSFEITLSAADHPFQFTLEAYSGANMSLASISHTTPVPVPGGSPIKFTIPFASFTGAADFTNINALQLIINSAADLNSPPLDVVFLRDFKTVGGPNIDIEKFTNGYDGDGANGAATATPPDGPFTPGDPRVAQVAASVPVVWTYRVTNTGGEDLVNIVVTDADAAAQGASILCPGTGNNTIPFLATGASADCTASLPGGARDLVLTDPDVVPGCGDGRPTYENMGEVVGFGATSNTQVSDEDPSHYCNPLVPDIELEKFTNGHDGDGADGVPTTTPPDGPFTPDAPEVAQVAVGGPVTWTYRVRNTGTDNLVNVLVTDAEADAQGAPIICPGTGNNMIPFLAIGASVDCTATLAGGARELQTGDPDVVPGCGDDRPTYENTGNVVGTGQTSGVEVDDTDDSHYCNPPEVEECEIKVRKLCKVLDRVGPTGGQLVKYKYIVKNIGTTDVLVNVFDDQLGPIASGVDIPAGTKKRLFKRTELFDSVTNIVTVTGTVPGTGATCEASKSAFVTFDADTGTVETRWRRRCTVFDNDTDTLPFPCSGGPGCTSSTTPDGSTTVGYLTKYYSW